MSVLEKDNVLQQDIAKTQDHMVIGEFVAAWHDKLRRKVAAVKPIGQAPLFLGKGDFMTLNQRTGNPWSGWITKNYAYLPSTPKGVYAMLNRRYSRSIPDEWREALLEGGRTVTVVRAYPAP